MSNILIITGSPRRGGNTDLLARAFLEGAQENHNVEVLSIADLHISPCTGCNACYKREEHTCVQQDDMPLIYEKLQKTDILVLASPVYFYGLSAQLKAVIDRLHTPLRSEFPVRKLGFLLVGAASLPNLFDPILLQYQMVLDYFRLESIGTVLVRNAQNRGDVLHTGALEEARSLGRSI